MEENSMEPLLTPNPQRFVLFPIQHQPIMDYYIKSVASFWTPEDIDLGGDMKDWITMSPDEHHYIKHVLAFFAASDGIVTENLATRFMGEVQYPEARMFYGFQIAMENIHSQVYSMLIDCYMTSDYEEKHKLFNAISTIPCVQRKAEWALKWMNTKPAEGGFGGGFGERLVAFCAVEGIFFSGSFCAIFWLKKRNLLPGLTFSNELISRDEALHCEFACYLLTQLVNPPSEDTIKQIITEAVEIEKSFVRDALPVGLIGMNANLMCQHIEYTADYWLNVLGCKPVYGSQQPFPWMELLSLQGKSNFFEKRVSEYARAGIKTSTDSTGSTGSERVFSLTEDF